MPRRRWYGLPAAIAVGALLVAPALPGATGARVLAHAQLVASTPAAGSVLETSPDELRLIFSEPLEAQLTSLDVVDQDGTAHLEHAGEIDPDDPYALVVSDPGLPTGVFSLTWRTLSAADGHTAEGFLTFGIGDVADSLAQITGSGTIHTERDPVAIAGRWLTYLGLLLALGLAVFHRVVIRAGPMPRTLARALAAGLAVAAGATMVAAVAAALKADGEIGEYLLGSRNGLLQVGRAAVAALGAAGLLVAPRAAARPIAAVTGLAGIGLLVLAGHASALAGPAPIVGGIVHVGAAAAWIGGLVGLLALAARPGLVSDVAPPKIEHLVPRFSAVALVSIGLVALAGLYAAWVQTGALLPLETEYGRTLVTKGVVAAAAIGLGGISYLGLGRLAGWLGGLRERLGIEVTLAAVVLAVTASLATTPPVEESRGIGIEPIPNAFGNVAPGMRMEIGPGRSGVNRVTVVTSDALAAVGGLELTLDRIDAGTTTRVPLTLTGLAEMEGMDHSAMAERNADGSVDWYADALVLPAGSSWDTSVHVMSEAGVELTRQRFAFSLDEAGIDEGRVTSLATPGTGIAALLLVGGALSVGVGLGGSALPRCEAAASRQALTAGGAVAVGLGLVIGLGSLVG